jgi:peptide/nickel transport system permease protein
VTEASTDFTIEATGLSTEERTIVGKSPWLLAWRRLRRNYVAFFFLGLFIVIVACCALAPVYAGSVAGTSPNENHVGETLHVGGKSIPVLSKGGVTIGSNGQVQLNQVGGVPVGPQLWHAGGRFVLGADTNGRDVAVRLLYGGLNSLFIGFASAALCIALAVFLALLAGYYGGWVDIVISRVFDIIWAFPVFLLAIAIGTALQISGFHQFGITISAGSLWIPILIIGLVTIPYIARPLRGQILSLREKEFVEAAIAQGATAPRVMFLEMLPNIASTVLVFFTLTIANNILFEAGLSFLGAGVQPPNPSWGTLISDGEARIVTAPWLAIIPGIAIVLTVLSLNIFGDGLRDALDPRSKVKLEH